MTTHDRRSPFLAATMAACLRTGTAPPTASAANENAGWRYNAPVGPGGRHVALVEQDGLTLTYAGSRDEGVTISADLWRPADMPARLCQQGGLQVDIVLRTRGMMSGTVYAVLGHFLYVNMPTVPSAGAQLVIPDTCWLSTAMQVNATFSLAGADAAIQQVNTGCELPNPPVTGAGRWPAWMNELAGTDPRPLYPVDAPWQTAAWDYYTICDRLEIRMPEDAEEIEVPLPGPGGIIFRGLRGVDNNITFAVLHGDSGAPSPATRRVWFDALLDATLSVARRNGVAARVVSVAGAFTRDLRIEGADGPTCFVRVTMVDDRVYLLLASGRATPGMMARKKHFLDTFIPLRGYAPPSSVEG